MKLFKSLWSGLFPKKPLGEIKQIREILTHSGRYFNFDEPEKSYIDIKTIAHALSNICRFTGHVDTFYSVAQHSVLVSYLVPPEHAMEGLVHDAGEAYIGDVATPLKSMLADYKTIEHRVEAAVLGHFGLPVIMHPSVKQADLKALATEKRDLMPDAIDGLPWDCIEGIEPHPEKIIPLSPEDAKNLFLARYYELKMLKESSKATNAKERKLNVLTSTNH